MQAANPRKLLPLVIAGALLITAPLFADYQEGIKAFKAGDYRRAAALLESEVIRSGQKRIGRDFVANGGLRTMTGVDGKVVSQRHDFLEDGLHQHWQ